MHKLITGANLQTFFPNIEVRLQIYLCLMVTNCSCEHSSSKLKRFKNELRSTMHQERLNCLTLMSVEHELFHEIKLRVSESVEFNAPPDRELIDKFAKVNLEKFRFAANFVSRV